MGDESNLEEIDASEVGARISSAVRGARRAAVAAVLLCLLVAGGLALNDARLASERRDALLLGEEVERFGLNVLSLVNLADGTVRRHGVSATTGWDVESSRSYSNLLQQVDEAFETDLGLEGEAQARLEEVERAARELLSRTQDALLVAALGHAEEAREWVNARPHRVLRTNLAREIRAMRHAAGALGERRAGEITTARRHSAFGGAAVVLLLLGGALGSSVRRSERAVREAGEELAKRAEFCGLTGLPNRSGFDALFAERVRRGAPFALVTLDLDGFKPINDTFGHTGGDRVLVRVAQRLSRFFGARKANGLSHVARLGGDEFAAFLALDANTALAARERRARAVAEDLRTVLTSGVPVGDGVASFGASMGIAIFPDHGADTDTLHNAADLALYRAKDQGGVCLYDPVFDEERRAFNAQKAEVARALEAGEFEPHLQAVVDLESGDVVSFEMLARWRRGDRVVGPGLFLAAIEKAGLLDALTYDLVTQVLDGAASWARPVPVSVNLAASQLRSPAFIERFTELLDRANAMGVAIEVELLEESVFSDVAATRLGLDALRQRNVRLAIDDFGVGYSNFAQLGRVAIDKIKIDRSFVMGMDEAAPAAVVRAALDISSAIGVGTVAEGIEDEATAERLRAMGCSLGQGYHFARPQPIADAAALLRVEIAATA